jgi:nicotinate phosphoribosyltransferase
MTSLPDRDPATATATDRMPRRPALTERQRALHAELDRYPASVFTFDPRMAGAWLSDRYFQRTAATLAHSGRDPVVTVQLFAKHEGIVAGICESIRMLETQLAPPGPGEEPHSLRDFTIDTLIDGDPIAPWETVMWIRGPYRAFAHLETPYLGVLARRSLVASNVRRVIEAADGKPVIYMGARHDDWRVQTPDGFAAMVGGAGAVSSHAGGAWWGASGVGTMPHAMIAAFDGDVVAASLAFGRYVQAQDPDTRIIVLVDYRNDCVGDSLAVARAMRAEFGDGSLSGVRLDTSEKLVDKSLQQMAKEYPDRPLHGVAPELVTNVRSALDAEGFGDVGIWVSGGFTPTKIREFERAKVPVAGYGIGSSLLGHNRGEKDGLVSGFDFTADIIRVGDRDESKVGRGPRPNPRLVRLDVELLLASGGTS